MVEVVGTASLIKVTLLQRPKSNEISSYGDVWEQSFPGKKGLDKAIFGVFAERAHDSNGWAQLVCGGWGGVR